MKTSYDEVRRMCFQALDAAGTAAGIDEDSAHGVAWLEAVGMPGLKTLADALDGSDAPARSGGIALNSAVSDAMTVPADGRSCVFFAPSLIDLMIGIASKSRAGRVSLRLENAAHPLYLIATAVRFCPADAKILLTWETDDGRTEVETTRNLVTHLSPDINAHRWETARPAGSVEMVYQLADNGERAGPSDKGSSFLLRKSAVGDKLATALRDGLDVDEEAHARVAAYTARILVPETEASRISGAGAGLTDND